MNARKMRSTAAAALCAASLILVNSRTVSAQYVVSARGGLVNYAGSDVQALKPGETTWVKVERLQQLGDGDRLRTGEHSRAEILLNPGSYLRMDRATEVEFSQTDLPSIAFGLNAGSAIVEAGALQGTLSILVRTPHSRIEIKKDGIYRIDTRAHITELAVHKGEAVLAGEGIAEKKIGRGKWAKIAPDAVDLAKLEDVSRDEFYFWSQGRAESSIASNRALVRRSGFRSGWTGNQWVFDSLFGIFTFVPFGSFYYSPYFSGYGYWCPLYGGGYWGGSYTGGVSPATVHEKWGKAIYALSPKAPGSAIQIVEHGALTAPGDRFSRAPIHLANPNNSGYSMGSSSSHAASGPTATGPAVAPIGKGKN